MAHSIPDSPPRASRKIRKRARVACSQCRQAKIRCVLEEIPCSRCARLGLGCSVNPSFRRTNKRDEVNELQQQVQNLQDIIENRPDAGLTNLPTSPILTPLADASLHRNSKNAVSTYDLATPSTVSQRTTELSVGGTVPEALPSVRALENTILTRSRAQSMFTAYGELLLHCIKFVGTKALADISDTITDFYPF